MISVIIPTVTGREEHYERCAQAYCERTKISFEVITEFDHPTVGLAWQAGAEKARGDYIALTCDDLEPQLGWDRAAMAVADSGAIPAPKVVNAHTGALESRPVWGMEFADGIDCGISVIPFMARRQYEAIQPFFLGHYYTDDFISDRARRAGWPSLMCNTYAFKHHWAQHRRGAGMTENQRMAHDYQLYQQALVKVTYGEWTEPWPE